LLTQLFNSKNEEYKDYTSFSFWFVIK